MSILDIFVVHFVKHVVAKKVLYHFHSSCFERNIEINTLQHQEYVFRSDFYSKFILDQEKIGIKECPSMQRTGFDDV